MLLVARNSGHLPDLLLVQLANATQSDSPLLTARLDPLWLWGGPDSFPYMTGFCVFSEHNHLLFCSTPDHPAGMIESASQAASAGHASDVMTEDHIIRHWQLFLKPRFQHEHWTVFAFQPVLMALAPIGHFTEIFIAVAVLTLLLAVLLSISQIRRTMGPLEKLIQGTRHIAGENFGYKVEIASKDEFGQLADSFNDMTDRLSRHRNALQALSRIDQAILTRQNRDTVIAIVFDRVRQINDAGLAGMTILEEAGAREAKACVCGEQGTGNIETTRILLSAEDIAVVSASPAGFWLENRDNPVSWLTTPVSKEIRRRDLPVFVLPVFYHTNLYAVMWLVLPDRHRLAGEIRAHLQQLGNRTGVALSAAARDELLIYQARHDDLTGLPNRFLFKERLLQEVAFARRQDHGFALLFIDLDRFKVINDSFGHSAGDALLIEAAQRLQQCVQNDDLVARLGGDEFAIILTGTGDPDHVIPVAREIVRALSNPFLAGEKHSHISASIGITMYPIDGTDGEELLKKADTAMYRAKDEGRNQFIFFEENMNTAAITRTTLERDLRQALSNKEFTLHYQPKMDARTGRVCGAEALLRWHHPVRGLISPATFIPVAEEIGLIKQIGLEVIQDACKQLTIWQQAGLHLPRLAINVSGSQFRDGELVREIGEIITLAGISARSLEIEVTETLFVDKTCRATIMLNQLRSMGMLVAIDDFGTGYSSMSYLKHLPVDVLKIDKSFVDEVVTDKESGLIVQAIITLAHTLGKTVVAEGIEKADQLAFLQQAECDIIQGYFFSRPLPPEQFLQFSQEHGVSTAQPVRRSA